MNCIVCNSANLSRFRYDNHQKRFSLKKELVAVLRKSKHPFKGDVGVCKDCGHGFLLKPPSATQLVDYYRSTYWSARNSITQDFIVEKDKYKSDLRASTQLSFIESYVNLNGLNEMLEIGAGPAFASLLVRDRSGNKSLELNVCEPGEVWTKHYNDHGVNRISEYFPFATDSKFDLIHASHWLEHVIDLDDTIQKLFTMTSPGGYVFIEVPNTSDHYWNQQLKDTPHIHFFTPRSISRAFENAGFTTVKVANFGHSWMDKLKAVKITENDYRTERSDGFWIRSLFKKP